MKHQDPPVRAASLYRRTLATVLGLAVSILVLASPAPATVRRPPAPSAAPSATPEATNSATPAPTETPSPEPTATPSPKSTPAPTPSPKRSPATRARHPQWIDGTFGLIGAVWKCATYAGTPLSHTFSRDDTGQNLIVNTDVSLNDGRSATVHEKYTHHPADRDWTATLAAGSVVVTAPEWTGDTWIFSGTSADGGKTSSVEMIYSRLGMNAFRRVFRKLVNGAWVTYTGELCDRPMHF